MMKHDSLFIQEITFLEEAKCILEDENSSSNELLPMYQELLNNYEKLLKTSIKTTRISDIQGKALKTKEIEIRKVKESRRRLISDISHELGSPMIAIERFMLGMINQTIKPEHDCLTLIYEKVGFVNRLIEELFDLAKLEEHGTTFRFEDVLIAEIRGLFRKFTIECELKQICLTVSPFENVCSMTNWFVSIDRFRFQQVITNLIENALKYTPEGGAIEVRGTVTTASTLLIEIEDTGVGIEADALPYIFERFFKKESPLNPKASSTGLGLAIAKEIITKHHGVIGARSELGKGSVFYFSLPIKKSAGARS